MPVRVDDESRCRGIVLDAWRDFVPPPRLDVDEWADLYRILGSKTSHIPGRWKTSRNPISRLPMKWLSKSHPCHTVTLMLPSQVFKTEVGINFIGYTIDHNPGPMLVVQPNREMARKFVKQRLNDLVEFTDVVREKIRGGGDGRTTDTLFEKDFPGGAIHMFGARSSSGLASTPAKNGFADEVDRWEADVGGEGDPLGLLRIRLSNFPDSKLLVTSTPTVKGKSRIESEFLDSVQHAIEVPCPHCGTYQQLEWGHLEWPKGKPEHAAYRCDDCEELIEDHHRSWMLERFEPVVIGRGEDPGHMGLWMNALYAPPAFSVSWADLAREYEVAEDHPHKMRVFVNTRLAQTFELEVACPDWQRLHAMREDYEIGTVPEGAVVLTAGVDVQGDRLEVEVVGWGKGLESWSVLYEVIQGDPEGDEVWERLDEIFDAKYRHESGALITISRMAIDRGYKTTRVDEYCRRKNFFDVMGVIGRNQQTILSRRIEAEKSRGGRKIKTGVTYVKVGVDILKRELYGWLGRDIPEEGEDFPPGWCHFPEYGQEFFKQLTAEGEAVRTRNGQTVYTFEKHRDRNEALDCRVYARAAAEAEQLSRLTDEMWDQRRADMLKPAPDRRARERRRGERRDRRKRNRDNRRRKSRWLD